MKLTRLKLRRGVAQGRLLGACETDHGEDVAFRFGSGTRTLMSAPIPEVNGGKFGKED